ncbi:MAG: transcription-repair coupling factor, partial [Acidimicrobiales bacterium]
MTSPALAPLLPALAAEPALASLLASEDATVAVADAARAYVLGGVTSLSSPSVIVVATANAAEAERLYHDLGCFLDETQLAYFPSWETLPFERVSPSVETMGRRLEALWRVAGARSNPGATLVVAPVKALVQRLAARPIDAAPIVVRAKSEIDPYGLVAALVAAGYRREYQVEHRGEVAVRGGIVDVFASTGENGIRIDCNGDEVERLTSFDVADQRSVADVDSVEIFACREFLPDDRRRARALELSTSAPFAREQFSRIADGEIFDGIESFAPFLDDETLLCDLLAKDDRVVLLEPRRMRDRVIELLDEEAALATSLAETWRDGTDSAPIDAPSIPRLHAPFDRLLSKTEARVASMLAVTESPGQD